MKYKDGYVAFIDVLGFSTYVSDEENTLFFQDIDGYTCLNPMSNILNEPIAYGPEGAVYPKGDINEIISSCFTKHRNAIIEQISKNKGTPVIDKHLWRARTFNYTCNLIADLPDGEPIYEAINFVANEQLRHLLKNQLITENDILKC